MDVSTQAMIQTATEQTGTRSVSPQGTSAVTGGNGGAQVTPFSQAFPNTANQTSPRGVVGLVDRIRADFEAFRARMNPTDNTSMVRAAGKTESERMESLIQHSLRTQVDIFEVSVSVNAGLTATQQSQSGVKTLIEKT